MNLCHFRVRRLIPILVLALGIPVIGSVGSAGSAEAGPRNPTLDEYYAWTVLRNEGRMRDSEWSEEFEIWLAGFYDGLRTVTAMGPKERHDWHIICFTKPVRLQEVLPGRILNVIKNAFRQGDWENIRQIRYADAAFSVMVQSNPCRGQ